MYPVIEDKLEKQWLAVKFPTGHRPHQDEKLVVTN